MVPRVGCNHDGAPHDVKQPRHPRARHLVNGRAGRALELANAKFRTLGEDDIARRGPERLRLEIVEIDACE